MGRLLFQTLAVENFKCFRGKHVFNLQDFPTGLNFLAGRNEVDQQLGSNGSGKSSLWGAFTWCLYGHTIDNLRNPDIKPWNGKGATTVRLQLNNGKVQLVCRTANPNKLTLNGKEVGQERIDALIGFDISVFAHTILLGQSQPLFFDLEPRQKMKVFADVLQLEKWNVRSKFASDFTAELRLNQENARGELEGLKSTLNSTKTLLDQAKDDAQRWREERAKAVNNNLEQTAELKKRIAKAKEKFGYAELAYDGARTEQQALDREIRKRSEELLKTQRYYNEQKQKKESLEREHDQLARALHKPGKVNCPTCGQKVEHPQKLKNNFIEIGKTLRGLDVAKWKKQIEGDEVVLTTLRHAADSFTSKANNAEAEKALYATTVSELSAKLQGLAELAKHFDEENNPHRIHVTKLQKTMTRLHGSISEVEEEIKKRDNRIIRTEFWIKGFKDIQLYVVEEVLQELEMTTNSMLPEIGLDDWNVQYVIEKETKSGTVTRGLNVMITSPVTTRAVKWESWSGGEAQRLRLIGALALSEVLLSYVGITTNLEILDEPTQHLSGEGVRDLCEFLGQRATQLKRQCWLVDHKAIPSSNFNSIVTVVKDKNGTRISSDY